MKRPLNCLYTFVYIIMASNCNGSKVLEDVVIAIEKAVEFYGESYGDMNIDGIFGLRVLEGQLHLVTRFLKAKPAAALSAIHLRLENAHIRAKNISETSLKVLKEIDQHYFELMHPVIQRPWYFGRNYRRIDPLLKWKDELDPTKSLVLNEMQSDKCMSELIGSKGQSRCSISDNCLKIMSTPGMSGYAITHQLLYTMLAEQSGCRKILNTKLLHRTNRSQSIEQLQAEFCVNNFFETSQSVVMQKGVIDVQLHDLFLEQELICTMLGYVEFLHIDWLQQIISWQRPSGCFGEPEETDVMKFERHPQHTTTIYMNRHLQLPLRNFTPARKSKLLGNLGSVSEVRTESGRNAQDVFVGLNSNVRKSRYNDSGSLKVNRFMGLNPLDKERGKIGKRRVHLRDNGNANVDEVNRNLGIIGETHVKVQGANGLLDTLPNNDNFRMNRQINRKLLYEKTLKGGCLAHKTAVAMGALSQYLRFLIFANSSGFDALNHLQGTNYLMHPDALYSLSARNTFSPSSVREESHTLRLSAVTPDVSDRNSPKISDELKADEKFDEFEQYDDNNIGTQPVIPATKNHEDDLILYDELAARKSMNSAILKHSTVAVGSFVQTSDNGSTEGVSSVSATYAVVVVITIVIMLLMYRLLRKHRTRHGRWR